MAGLWWMAVTLGLLLSAGSSVAVNQNQLAGIVNEMLNRYTPSYKVNNSKRRFPMFSLAVSIPYNSDTAMYDISKVTDDPDQVKNTILKCGVYASTRVVAATVLRWPNVLYQCPEEHVQWPDVLIKCRHESQKVELNTWLDVDKHCRHAVKNGRADHAEYRTLQSFNNLTRNLNKNDLLLFYVLSSPCDKRCTNEGNQRNILDDIKQILSWDNYTVVFSNIFKPRSGKAIPEKDLREALERLGRNTDSSGRSIGLNNIFRCTRKDAMQCTSCSSGGQVTPYCYSDDLQPGPQSYSPSQWSRLQRQTKQHLYKGRE